MMSIKVDWNKLRSVRNKLAKWPNITDTSEIVFIIITRDKSVKKSVVQFRDFIGFFWSLSENDEYDIIALVVQDKDGRVLYRHKNITSGGEEIPIGGNPNVIRDWNILSPEDKSVYIDIMTCQIQNYDNKPN